MSFFMHGSNKNNLNLQALEAIQGLAIDTPDKINAFLSQLDPKVDKGKLLRDLATEISPIYLPTLTYFMNHNPEIFQKDLEILPNFGDKLFYGNILENSVLAGIITAYIRFFEKNSEQMKSVIKQSLYRKSNSKLKSGYNLMHFLAHIFWYDYFSGNVAQLMRLVPVVARILPSILTMQDDVGDTPLHIAVKHDNFQFIYLALPYITAKDLHIKNNAGKTPLQLNIEKLSDSMTGYVQKLINACFDKVVDGSPIVFPMKYFGYLHRSGQDKYILSAPVLKQALESNEIDAADPGLSLWQLLEYDDSELIRVALLKNVKLGMNDPEFFYNRIAEKINKGLLDPDSIDLIRNAEFKERLLNVSQALSVLSVV